MICDFGLSRVIDSEKIALLTEICGTPGVSLDHSHLTSSLLNPMTRTNFSTWRQRFS